jgi:hypothetical protein
MIRRTGALVLLVAAVACAPASAANTVPVNVRVEGIKKTLFEGRIVANVHGLDGRDGTGRHKCDGTNGGANPQPGPTLLSAFDTAMLRSHRSWAGRWDDGFQDFALDRVGPDSNDTEGGRYWGQVLNFQDTQVGGCQQQLKVGDQVLVAFNSYGHPKLRLTGPKQATAGKPFQVTVTDGATGKPVAGALVHGSTTDTNGHVDVTLLEVRRHRFKARAKGAIRSNALRVDAKA